MRAEPVDATRRRTERLLFLLLAVVIWPFIAIGVVAGWGFAVWMYYLFTGPPGTDVRRAPCLPPSDPPDASC